MTTQQPEPSSAKTDKIVLHASQTPRAVKCPASIYAAAQCRPLNIEPFNEQAALGSAIHELAAAHITGHTPNIGTLAARYGVAESELVILSNCFGSLWRKIAHLFANPTVETQLSIEFETFILQGKYDLRGADANNEVVAVLDWKSGWRTEADYRTQLATYAVLTVKPATRKIWTGIAWLRNGIIEGRWYDRDEIETWRVTLQQLVAKALHNWRNAIFNTGAHCAYCPAAAANCNALPQWLLETLPASREDIDKLTQNFAQKEMRGQILVTLLEAARQLETRTAAFREALRAFVAANQPIPTANGELRLVEKIRTTIITERAWPYLRETLGDDVLSACKISLPKLIEIAKKKKAAAELQAQLASRQMIVAEPHYEVREVTQQGKETEPI